MKENSVTQLVEQASKGDANASGELLPKMYDELRRLASFHMVSENKEHTLQATALVNEAYLKMLGNDATVLNRTHFMALSSQAMRRILVDHARGKNRQKRPGQYLHVTLSETAQLSVTDNGLLELNDALNQLAEFDERAAQAVELMFFSGLTYEETALHLGVGRSTIYEDVKAAKAWLAVKLDSTDIISN